MDQVPGILPRHFDIILLWHFYCWLVLEGPTKVSIRVILVRRRGFTCNYSLLCPEALLLQSTQNALALSFKLNKVCVEQIMLTYEFLGFHGPGETFHGTVHYDLRSSWGISIVKYPGSQHLPSPSPSCLLMITQLFSYHFLPKCMTTFLQRLDFFGPLSTPWPKVTTYPVVSIHGSSRQSTSAIMRWSQLILYPPCSNVL